nr:SDR family NAD(P)-dependent oxidoreductase [Paraburkholderia sp. J63]
MNTQPVVLITGALTGIGHATALAYARDKARVVVSGRRDEAGRALAEELRALGGEVEYIRAAVSKEDEVRALVEVAPISWPWSVSFGSARVGRLSSFDNG